MLRRVIGDVGAINRKGLTGEKVCEGLVGGGRVANASSGHVNATYEIVAQVAVHTEASTDASAVAIEAASAAAIVLEEILAANAHVSGESEAADEILQGGNTLLIFLRRLHGASQIIAHVGDVAL